MGSICNQDRAHGGSVSAVFMMPSMELDIMRFKLTPLTWGLLDVIIVFALGVVDWLTGYELNFFVFYFLPVSIGAWFFGFIGAVSLAILSAGVWYG